MAPIRDWTGAITFSPTSPHKIRRSVKSPKTILHDRDAILRVCDK